MNEEDPIQAFIKRRWAGLRYGLQRTDPDYLHAVESYWALSAVLVLPHQAKPKHRLLTSTKVKLLETTVTVALAVENSHMTEVLMKEVRKKRVAHWYLDMWYQNAFNLLEHIKVMITLTCNLYSLGDLDKKYHSQIDDFQGKIGELRHPLVHGPVDPGTVVNRAITEDEQHSWEYYAAIGPEVIRKMLEYESEEGLSPQDLHDVVAAHTSTLLSRTGHVLRALESDIDKYTDQPDI